MASLSTSLILLPLFLGLMVCRSSQRCEIWEGRNFRNCYCGTEVLDHEEHCQSDLTYFDVQLSQDKRSCPFQCLNGGNAVFIPVVNYYYCQCRRNYYGGCCERETKLCGGLLLEPTGVISSPRYPDHYPNYRDCVWKIATDPGKRIALGVKGPFNVEAGSSINTCNNDWVSVHDGNTSNSKEIGPFCGNATRPFQTIHSTSQFLYVKFHSNEAVKTGGFQLEYTTYREGFRCGPRREYTLPTAIITSPQYPLSYKPQEDCEYEIFIQPQHELIISTLHMNLPSSADCSNGDTIKVYKKTSYASRYEMITILCGKENYDLYTIRDVSQVLLKFSSGLKSRAGGQFKLRYQQIPF